MSKAKGNLIISIDFELRWGVQHLLKDNIKAYSNSLACVREIVSGTLKAFDYYDIRATWASVGALAALDWEDYFSLRPESADKAFATKAYHERMALLDPSGSLHFAFESLQEIVATNGQELGTHTFSHLDASGKDVTAEIFALDLLAAEKVFNDRLGVRPTSLVFPRNAIANLAALERTNVLRYRGSDFYPLLSKNGISEKSLIWRARRYTQNFVRFSSLWENDSFPMVSSGLFMRFGLPEFLWKRQITMLKRHLNAPLQGHSLHLWWHPHNLGFDPVLAMKRLHQLCQILSEAKQTGLIESVNMSDVM